MKKKWCIAFSESQPNQKKLKIKNKEKKYEFFY